MVVKQPGGKYAVISHSGKPMGEYASKAEAQKRLQQIEFFKIREAHKNAAPTRQR
jgi:hypothetical protein